MTNYWIFQANPKHYDVDAALQELTEIRWRVPQYTGAVAAGNGVVLWRSGTDAGIIGVGRVTGPAAECATDAAEQKFVTDPTEEGHATTRVPLAVKLAAFVPKADVAALPEMAEHQIVTAPMGTVFPLTPEQWSALAPLLPELPSAPSPETPPELTPVFAWEQRRKDVYPLPGGYGGYLESLEVLLREVSETEPSRGGLESFMRASLGVSETSARFAIGFLLRTGLLAESASSVELGPVAAHWLADGEPAPLVALLHARVRFIGEFLAETVAPRTDSEILEIANRFYGAGWKTKAQIRRRRGWLESAGMLAETGDGRLQTTDVGRALVERLDLRPRSGPGPTTPPEPEPAIPGLSAEMRAFVERLRAASVDGSDPDRFEQETTEAFRRLGFTARWLGGAGKTDVLLEADLGRDQSYRVVIDCKSTSRGTVSQQIDWDTIDEHREQHGAQHAAIVAPGFGGGRLPERAERHEAIMLTVDDLAELLAQHSQTPLSLDTYRLLFSGTTEDGMAAVGEAAEESKRRVELMRAVLALLHRYGKQKGALSAREVELLLMTADDLTDATEQEIAEVLALLSSPLVGALVEEEGSRVRPSASLATAAQLLRVLADQLDATAGSQDDPPG